MGVDMEKELLNWIRANFTRRPLSKKQIRDIYTGWRLDIKPSVLAKVVGCSETTIRKHYDKFDRADWLKGKKVKDW